MIASDDVEDQADDDLDDTLCTRQRPKQRCCLVWHQVGTYIVLGCTHCPRVKASWTAQTGDAERASLSRETHDQMCVRECPWLVYVPEPRRQSSTRATAPTASRTPSTSGRW